MQDWFCPIHWKRFWGNFNNKGNMNKLVFWQLFISAKNLEATIIDDLLDGNDPLAFPFDDDKSVEINVSYYLI